MPVLCGISTIQYSARSARLYVHRLFTSCIQRCLVSRACNRMMSVLSAALLIYSFQFRSAFLSRQSTRQHSSILGLPNIRHRTSPKIWGFLNGAYSTGEWLWIDSNSTNVIEGSFGTEFLAICNHCIVMVAWSHKMLKFCQEFLRFLEKTTRYGNFSNFSSKGFHCLTDRRVVFKFSWSLVDGKSVKSCVACLTNRK